MKIIRQYFGDPKAMTMKEFAENYDLTLKVVERSPSAERHGLPRFYAAFQGVETTDGSMLVGVFGSGNTEAEAIADYAHELSGNRVVIHAMTPGRVEVDIPRDFSAEGVE